MATRSNALIAPIREHLEAHGWKVSRNTSGRAHASGSWFVVGETGRPDLEAFKPAPNGYTILLFVEAKPRNDDRLRPAQAEWLTDARAHGAITITAQSLADVTTALEKLP